MSNTKSSLQIDYKEDVNSGLPLIPPSRRKRLRNLIGRIRKRSNSRRLQANSSVPITLRGRRRKRKAVLALSAATMAIGTAATDIGAPPVQMSNPSEMRIDADQLAVSTKMKAALAEEEGVKLTVYRDVSGNATVGIGHLVLPEDNLAVGDTITYGKAIALFDKDLALAEDGVRDLAGDLPLYQHEFDALVDLVFNVGTGAVSPDASPKLNLAIQSGDYDGIAQELDYHYSGGAKAGGLVYRSERREAIFLEATYADPRQAALANIGTAIG